MTDPASEGAKAAQEIAKTTGKGIDAVREAGGFIAKYIHAPLDQAIAIWTDKLRYVRWERQMALMQLANAKLAQLGLPHPTQAIPLKLAIPLIQEGSMEEDDYLQERWANLLVNAANASSGIEVRTTYIGMLRDMTSLDVQILSAIYSLPYELALERQVWTGDLPRSARIIEVKEEPKLNDVVLPTEVTLSLENLRRLGCVASVTGFYGGTFHGRILPTTLGHAFVRACTLDSGK